MRIKSLKRVLATTLAATMVMASALTVSATTEYAGDGSCSSSSSTSETTSETTSEAPAAPATYAEQNTKGAGAVIMVGTAKVKTSVEGVYAAKSVKGCAVTASAADVAAALTLPGGAKAAIIIYDTDQKKSSKAMDSVNAAIASIGGGDMVASLNIDLGAKKGGKWVALSNGSIGLKAGLPKGADTSKTYSVVCVQPGGTVSVLEDQDADPNTVTFAVKAGLGTYAIVAR